MYLSTDTSVKSSEDTREAQNFIGETSINFPYTGQTTLQSTVLYTPSNIVFHTAQTGSIKSLLLSSWTGGTQGESEAVKTELERQRKRVNRAVPEQLSSSRIQFWGLSSKFAIFPQVWFLQVSLEYGIILPDMGSKSQVSRWRWYLFSQVGSQKKGKNNSVLENGNRWSWIYMWEQTWKVINYHVRRMWNFNH